MGARHLAACSTSCSGISTRSRAFPGWSSCGPPKISRTIWRAICARCARARRSWPPTASTRCSTARRCSSRCLARDGRAGAASDRWRRPRGWRRSPRRRPSAGRAGRRGAGAVARPFSPSAELVARGIRVDTSASGFASGRDHCRAAGQRCRADRVRVRGRRATGHDARDVARWGIAIERPASRRTGRRRRRWHYRRRAAQRPRRGAVAFRPRRPHPPRRPDAQVGDLVISRARLADTLARVERTSRRASGARSRRTPSRSSGSCASCAKGSCASAWSRSARSSAACRSSSAIWRARPASACGSSCGGRTRRSTSS